MNKDKLAILTVAVIVSALVLPSMAAVAAHFESILLLGLGVVMCLPVFILAFADVKSETKPLFNESDVDAFIKSL